ncbi:hypothetical protein FC62_GL000369 [Amylolactobacillus amylotrophicus DSM 20534]|uniref:Uncharacterized protein n=3 Tax=Amylolactobacillus TaxID=2767876 RepID=A0A0R1YP65_9LACO|nr:MULTISPECIES: hypothetical protein [Amylolactobacillus]APT19052.1 hypothetical protein LA20533_07260 [Amylolactobacillus amylophilus DSM 20533 = JCM 1125]KRK38681.1 hypothetical protein FC62_GL000369 [Amylolactobacillus amylotrophicus DSM 20534]KRM42676.1 hypothetical protein FD40_GL000470 [Amylolactobacillus amylophilus DSM 20533 = JCM 1125]GED79535.1 hypothetical protein LAM01_00080 [Amylolactobacillus amylophilus]
MDNKYLPVLEFIRDNSAKVIQEPTEYANQLTFAFSKKFADFNVDVTLFPVMRLHVERLDRSFVNANADLFIYFFNKVSSQSKSTYKDVWVTTSDVSNRDLLLVELSFE